jgi:N-methylhydantoinase A
MSVRVGIDTGGTFTDLVAVDSDSREVFQAKVPSTPDAPIDAVMSALALADVPLASVEHTVLGTTVGANAMIERRGATVAYLATEGFEDVPFIQRGNRRYHYDLHWRKPRPFLDRWQCSGVRERIDQTGSVVAALTNGECAQVAERVAGSVESDGVEAVAINLLFSFVEPRHEQRLADAIRQRCPGVPVSVSHEVAPVWREYERGVTTIADAYLKPLLGRFAGDLVRALDDAGVGGECSLLRSGGGTQPLARAAGAPVQLLLSGVAGGVMAGKRFGLAVSDDLITLDMGGTSADIAVISGREHGIASSHEVEFGLPLLIPSIDVATIGAGGGSVAWVDRGGFLRVGPRSAGADPGPVCYGRGGSEPTVTDANLVLGRLDASYFLGGRVTLDSAAAANALAWLGAAMGLSTREAALAVVEIAGDAMVDAIRLRTVEVGVDPRRHCLVAFGGAAGLHAVAIARRLGIRQVVVPPRAGLGSAVGALTADLRSDRVATVRARSDRLDAGELQARVRTLRERALADVASDGDGAIVTARAGLRYLGQNYEHEVAFPDGVLTLAALSDAFARFEGLHREFYGYDLSGEVIELVDLTVTATVASTVEVPATVAVGGAPNAPARQSRRGVQFASGAVDTPVLHRDGLAPGEKLAGPLIVQDADATTLLEAGDRLVVARDGSLIIDVDTTTTGGGL